MMLKSIHGLSHGLSVHGTTMLICNTHDKTPALLEDLQSRHSILKGFGRTPVYLNGIKYPSRKAALVELEQSDHKMFILKACKCESLGYERVVSIMSFKSRRAFYKTTYCRKHQAYTKEQLDQFELVTEG